MSAIRHLISRNPYLNRVNKVAAFNQGLKDSRKPVAPKPMATRISRKH